MIICEFSNKNTEFLNIVFRFMNGCWLHTFVENESFVTCWLQRVARLQRAARRAVVRSAAILLWYCCKILIRHRQEKVDVSS